MSAWQSLKFIFDRFRGAFIVLVVLVFAGGALEGIGLALFMPLLSLITSGAAIDLPFLGTTKLLPLLGIIVGIFAFKNIFLFAQKALTAKLALQLENRLRTDLLASAYQAMWPVLSQKKAGSLINIAINQMKFAGDCLRLLVLLSSETVNILAYCLIGLWISWPAFALSSVVASTLFFLSRTVLYKSKDLGGKALALRNEGVGNVIEDMSGMKFIKGNGVERERSQEVFRFFERVADVDYRAERLSAVMQTLPDFLMIVTACAILGFSHLVLRVPGESLLVLIMVLYRMNRRLVEAQVLRQRLAVYLPSLEQCLDLTRNLGQNAEKKAGASFKGLREGIEVERVNFAYDSKSVLDGVSLSIKKNQFVAVTGRSGCGKTTLLDLLLGLIRPTHGRITVDGLDLVSLDIFSWRKKICYLSQDAWMTNGTIADNLRLLKPEATMDEVRDAAKAAFAHDFIEELPQSYDTQVGDRGFKLSGGQKQRIALARAFLRKPEVLLLDEATSALDGESERVINGALRSLKGKMTIVVVAHRSSLTECADVVYEIEGARIKAL